MICHAIEPLLSAYADRELSADEFRNVTRHLAQCKACETKAALIREMKSAVTQQPRAALPVDLRMAIQAQTVGSLRPQGRIALNWWIPTLVFAAAAGSGLILHLNKTKVQSQPAEAYMVQSPAAAPAPNQIAWHKPDVSSSTLQ
jgi:anti-sigma factor RsiW